MSARLLFKLSSIMNIKSTLSFRSILNKLYKPQNFHISPYWVKGNIGNKVIYEKKNQTQFQLNNDFFKNKKSQQVRFISTKNLRLRGFKNTRKHRNKYITYQQKRSYCSREGKEYKSCPPLEKVVEKPSDYETIKLGSVQKIGRKMLPNLPIGDCCCIDQEPLDDVKPLARLKARKIREPPRVCKGILCNEENRSDYKLKVKQKRLPFLENGHCPCVEPQPIKDVKPLTRLPKKKFIEPSKFCPPPPCPPRADDGLKLKMKKLSKIEPGVCSCIESIIDDVRPLKKLKPLPVKEPPKICPCVEEECCLERADKNLKIESKQLPVIKSSSCPCVEQKKLEDVKFKRLPKKKLSEPSKICPPTPYPPRADDGIKIERKKLSNIETGECLCIEPMIDDVPPLPKLKAIPIKEPPRVCPCVEDECCPERADKNIKIAFKQLPKIEAGECPCVEPEPLEDVSLARLPKKRMPEPLKVCPIPCVQEKEKVKPKKLPQIPTSCCPCIDPELPTKTPIFKRLPKCPEVDPPRICPCAGDECCLERSDKNLKITSKQLPKIESGECPCFDPEPLEDMSLARLPKKCVPEPQKICPVPCVREKEKVKPKKLPQIPTSCCPCIDPELPTETPVFQRLPKCPEVDPPRICPCVDEECCPERADKNLKIKSKPLPSIETGECPCVEPEPLEDVSLARLPKKRVPEPQKNCPVPCVREKEKVKPKKLPQIPTSCCPCIDPELPTETPVFQRLPKCPVVDPPRICPCVDEECCPERADKNLNIISKPLPSIEAGKCACVETDPMEDVPLKRLPKKHVPEPQKICPTACVREKEKSKPKKLPEIPTSCCPCIDPELPTESPRLKRLPKCPKVDPPKVCPEDPCKTNRRADEHDWEYMVKKGSEPCSKNESKCNKRDYSTYSFIQRRHYSQNFYELHSIDLKNLLKTHSKLHLRQNSVNTDICINLKDNSSFIKNNQTCEGNYDIDSFNNLAYKIVMSFKNSKELLILPWINLFHQASYFCNASKNLASYMQSLNNRNKSIKVKPKETKIPIQFNDKGKVKSITVPQELFFDSSKSLNKRKPVMESSKVYMYTSTPIHLAKNQLPKDTCSEGEQEDDKKEPKKKAATVPNDEPFSMECLVDSDKAKILKQKTEECKKPLWDRIVNYFKPRDCPSPEEFKLMRLRAEAEKAAAKAGLCVYNPNESDKDKGDLPKVITPKSCKKDNEEC